MGEKESGESQSATGKILGKASRETRSTRSARGGFAMQDAVGLNFVKCPEAWQGLKVKESEIEKQVLGKRIIGIYPNVRTFFKKGKKKLDRYISGFMMVLKDEKTGEETTVNIDNDFMSDYEDESFIDVYKGIIEPEVIPAEY